MSKKEGNILTLTSSRPLDQVIDSEGVEWAPTNRKKTMWTREVKTSPTKIILQPTKDRQ